jgi:hypothetical protein
MLSVMYTDCQKLALSAEFHSADCHYATSLQFFSGNYHCKKLYRTGHRSCIQIQDLRPFWAYPIKTDYGQGLYYKNITIVNDASRAVSE